MYKHKYTQIYTDIMFYKVSRKLIQHLFSLLTKINMKESDLYTFYELSISRL